MDTVDVFDAEFAHAVQGLLPAFAEAPKFEIHDIQGRREAAEAAVAASILKIPVLADDVEIQVHQCQSFDGTAVDIYHFQAPVTSRKAGPAVVHFHGGGFYAGSVSSAKAGISQMVSATGVQVFSVDYRLVPEHPHPAPLEDCYAGLRFVQERASWFNIDPARIAVMGESAGGGLAAGVALLTRDRGCSPKLAKQILVYPMLDDRTCEIQKENDKYLLWKTADNITAWAALLGDSYGTSEVSPYAAPGRMDNLDDLPATYIDVGGADLFLGENIAYVTRLLKSNVTTEFHLYPGLPHGFEILAPEISATSRAVENRKRAMNSI